jgi:uncharacterized protein (TIGR03435 family)
MSFQVVGGPDWAREDRFEIDARAGGVVTAAQVKHMVQSLLEERFKLVLRKDQQEMQFAALTVAQSDGRLGPKLEQCKDPDAPRPVRPLAIPRGGMAFGERCVPISAIAIMATGAIGSPVLDKSGLTGLWNYQMAWAIPAADTSGRSDVNLATFPVALEEQLGLRLETTRGPVDVLVIESVEPPDEN